VAASWLVARGWPVLYLGPGDEINPWFETPIARIGADFIAGKEGRSMGLFDHFRLVLKILKYRMSANKQSIFYVQGSSCTPAAWVALLGFSRRRVIYETLDFLEPGKHRHWEFFERKFARRAGRCIGNEPNRARFFQSYYKLKAPAASVHTALPRDWNYPQRDPALRIDLLSKTGRRDDGQQRLIMVGGGYGKARMTQELMEAVKMLPANYLLVFTGTKAGSTAEEQTRSAAEAVGIGERCIYLGFLDFDDLLRHFAVCDIGILLYPNDGVGNFYQSPGRLAEYLGVGLPFVTSNFPGLELLTLKYDIGVACDPYDPEQIAMALQAIGDRPEAALAEDRQRLRQLAREELSYDAQAFRMEDIVKAAMGLDAPPV
jgi:glycosyltransferase involved in cell wall biosynthesis